MSNCQFYKIGLIDSSWFSGYYFITASTESNREIYLISKRKTLFTIPDNDKELLTGGKIYRICLIKIDTSFVIHSQFQGDPGIVLDSILIYSEGKMRVDVYESINIIDKYYCKLEK